jgi:hypothetical protein
MRKADVAVQEVVCSETGKPMPKIPLWMANIKVKFVSDEARQKHPTPSGLLDSEPERRSIGSGADMDELKDVDTVGAVIDDEEEAEYDEIGEEDGDRYE